MPNADPHFVACGRVPLPGTSGSTNPRAPLAKNCSVRNLADDFRHRSPLDLSARRQMEIDNTKRKKAFLEGYGCKVGERDPDLKSDGPGAFMVAKGKWSSSETACKT